MNYTAEQINMAFSKLSETTSKAISRLNIKERENEIMKKYNIQPDAAVILSSYIIFALIGVIEKKDFELRLKEDLNLSREDSVSISKDINNIIFEEIKNIEGEIKENERIANEERPANTDNEINSKGAEVIGNYQLPITNKEITTNEKKVEEDEVPKPPYVISSKEQVVSSIENQSSTQEIVSSKEENKIQNTPKSAFEEKLKGPTISEHTVSDYSKSKTDPYREQF